MAHVAETNPDITLGFSFISAALSVLILSVMAFPILNNLGSSGFFLFFAAFALGSFFYMFCVLKESKGLTDRQKKKLYRPAHLITEEKMRQQEEAERHTNIAASIDNNEVTSGDGNDA